MQGKKRVDKKQNKIEFKAPKMFAAHFWNKLNWIK